MTAFLWRELRSPEDRLDTARHYRVFPGEGVHNEALMQFVRAPDDQVSRRSLPARRIG